MGYIDRMIILTNLEEEYDKRYQANCHRNSVDKKTPYTLFHKIIDDMKTELLKDAFKDVKTD